MSSPLLSDEGMGRVRRKKDFCHMDRVDGRPLNVLQGLELHTAVFSPEEQRAIVAAVLDLQDRGRRGLLRERTYLEPRKWMRGKGRATIQFGCCYNYATDKDGNPPGIVRDSAVDPLPPLLAAMVRRLVLWRVLPRACVPDSCIVNIYDVDDCIPPHVDSHDFLRPLLHRILPRRLRHPLREEPQGARARGVRRAGVHGHQPARGVRARAQRERRRCRQALRARRACQEDLDHLQEDGLRQGPVRVHASHAAAEPFCRGTSRGPARNASEQESACCCCCHGRPEPRRRAFHSLHRSIPLSWRRVAYGPASNHEHASLLPAAERGGDSCCDA